MCKRSFGKLHVWQDSIDLVESIYTITKGFPNSETYTLISQMRRSAVSIASNLAEGTSRITNNDKAHFSTIAFSPTMELKIILFNNHTVQQFSSPRIKRFNN